MGPGFVLMFWLFVAIVYTAIIFGFGLIWFIARRKDWKIVKWITGGAAIFMTCMAVLVGGGITWGVLNSMNPRSVYKDTFGSAPPSELKDIESDVYWFADTGSVHLRFAASPEQFRLLHPGNLAEVTAEEVKKQTPAGSTHPDWWDCRIDPGWIYRLRVHGHGQDKPGERGFYWEYELFAYDPKNQIAYYQFEGID